MQTDESALLVETEKLKYLGKNKYVLTGVNINTMLIALLGFATTETEHLKAVEINLRQCREMRLEKILTL